MTKFTVCSFQNVLHNAIFPPVPQYLLLYHEQDHRNHWMYNCHLWVTKSWYHWCTVGICWWAGKKNYKKWGYVTRYLISQPLYAIIFHEFWHWMLRIHTTCINLCICLYVQKPVFKKYAWRWCIMNWVLENVLVTGIKKQIVMQLSNEKQWRDVIHENIEHDCWTGMILK
jgi:hypothetical protein